MEQIELNIFRGNNSGNCFPTWLGDTSSQWISNTALLAFGSFPDNYGHAGAADRTTFVRLWPTKDPQGRAGGRPHALDSWPVFPVWRF